MGRRELTGGEWLLIRVSVQIDVAFVQDNVTGWAPVTHLGHLAARLCGGRAVALPAAPSRVERFLNMRRRRIGPPREALLAILRSPSDVAKLRAMPEFRSGYRQVAAWVIDSFLHEWLPSATSLRDLDLIAVMRPNDEAVFARAAPGRVIFLGWGSDVLDMGCGADARSVDVLRLGRQPREWDDDAVSGAACSNAGLRFAGRPPVLDDPAENQRAIMEALAGARFVIAHSNLAAPVSYTHHLEEYLTARWTDSLACGAIVAGVQPHGDASMTRLLWPGAVLDFDRIDLAHNVAALAEARAIWSPEDAAANHREALVRLDWRWRLAELLARLGLDMPPVLAADLMRLRSLAALS